VPFAFTALAHIKRRERPALLHLDHTFAHQLECGRKARCEHGWREGRLYNVRDQILIEPRPVRCLSDETLERLTRFGKRPHRTLDQAHARECRALPLPG